MKWLFLLCCAISLSSCDRMYDMAYAYKYKNTKPCPPLKVDSTFVQNLEGKDVTFKHSHVLLEADSINPKREYQVVNTEKRLLDTSSFLSIANSLNLESLFQGKDVVAISMTADDQTKPYNKISDWNYIGGTAYAKKSKDLYEVILFKASEKLQWERIDDGTLEYNSILSNSYIDQVTNYTYKELKGYFIFLNENFQLSDKTVRPKGNFVSYIKSLDKQE